MHPLSESSGGLDRRTHVSKPGISRSGKTGERHPHEITPDHPVDASLHTRLAGLQIPANQPAVTCDIIGKIVTICPTLNNLQQDDTEIRAATEVQSPEDDQNLQRSRRRRRRFTAAGEEGPAEEFCNWFALVVAVASIALAPWFMGSVIPHGKLLLQCGAVVASVVFLAGCLIARRLPFRISRPVICLLGLCLIAVVQLLPIWQHPVFEMRHAVFPELAGDLPATQGIAGQRMPGTCMPAETRQLLGQYLAIALLGLVIAETTGTIRRAVTACGMLAFSGSLMALLALGQQLGAKEVVFGNQWKISPAPPFGCFVNPNNAAGWLIICLACCLFCTGVAFGKTPETARAATRRMNWRERIGQTLGAVARQVGAMTQVQAGLSLICVLLLVAIAGTLSRAGIIAGCITAIAFFGSRLQTERWFLALCGISLLLVLAGGLLLLLELDTPILTELETLKDPVSPWTIRVVHWADTLSSVQDFPLLGSGLGAYSYATLPYQRHYSRNWFEHADNQYFELLIEAGIPGLLLGILAGVAALTAGIRLTFAGPEEKAFVRRRYGDWAGSALLGMMFGLIGQVFLDFSLALPGIMAAAMLLACMTERRREHVADQQPDATPEPLWNRPWPLGRRWWLVLPVWLLALTGTMLTIPRLYSAARGYQAYVDARRMIDKRDADDLVENGDRVLQNITEAIRISPEIEDLLRTRGRLMELLGSAWMLQESIALDPIREQTEGMQRQRRNERLRQLLTNPYTVRFLSNDYSETPGLLRDPLMRALQKYPWRDEYRKVLQTSPFVPAIAGSLYSVDQFFGKQPDEDRILYHFLFSTPHAAEGLAVLGHHLILANRVDDGMTFWNQALKVSEKFRAEIMALAADMFGTDQTLQLFLPDDFEACAAAGLDSRPGAVRDALLQRAEQLWVTGGFRQTNAVVILRGRQLCATGRSAEGLQVLRDALQLRPFDIELRKTLALLLDENGLYAQSLDEWIRYEQLVPGDPIAEKAIKELAKRPPTRLEGPKKL